VRSGHYAGHWKPGEGCWCVYDAEEIAAGRPPSGFSCSICHSFVTDGQIQFLGDCTHKLAGRTVPLPAWANGELEKRPTSSKRAHRSKLDRHARVLRCGGFERFDG